MLVLFVYNSYEGPGVEYLSSVLKAAGHETHLLYDPGLFVHREGYPASRTLARLFDQRKFMCRQVKDYRPDVVAFSVVSADYRWACDTARMIKEWADVPIVFGNIHPSAIPEKVILNDFVDYIVMGEGEYAFLDLVNSLESKKPDYSIKNVWTKRNGEVVSNPLRPLIADLDSLPFPDRELFRRVGVPFDIGIMALGRRGCRHACTYCSNSLRRRLYFGDDFLKKPGFVRRRSVENLIRELEEEKEKHDFKLIRFNDDDFIEDEAWLREFSGKYRERVGVSYKCFVSPESVNENALRLLKESNCGQIQMGVQSLNPSVRKEVLRRNYTNSRAAEVIDLIRQSGIPLLADTLLGIPGETEEDMVNMVKFFFEHPPGGYVNAYWLLYFAGHDIVQVARERGVASEQFLQDLEHSPFPGTNVDRDAVHPRKLIKYQTLVRMLNYFPRFMTKWVLQLKLYRLFPPFDFLWVFRVIYKFKFSLHRKDVFPDPRDVYELIGMRRRAEYFHHVLWRVRNMLRLG